jgi:hypothetical protein
MDLSLFGLRPNKSKTIRQKNLKKIKFYQMPIYLDVAGSEGEEDDAKGESSHDSHAVDALVVPMSISDANLPG